MQRLRETRAICRRCLIAHPAEVVMRDGKVIGITHCPEGRDEVELSSHPELYMALTSRSVTPLDAPPSEGLKYVLNYISITNACNFHCTVCSTDAGGPDKKTFLPVDEIVRRARLAYEAGGRILHLFGGEPTLHPELCTVIRRLTDIGLSVGLVSNGLELGRKPELAPQLKACGLKRVCLQFDSLEHAPLGALARDFLKEKQSAIRHTIDAGLDLGLNCTATQQTLPELGALVEHGISLGMRVRNMTFGCAAPIGRFTLPPDTLVDREQIVGALLRTSGCRYFTLEDILPLPCYLPWGLQVHPDCGVHVLMLRHPGGITALNRLVDLPRLYARLARSKANGFLFHLGRSILAHAPIRSPPPMARPAPGHRRAALPKGSIRHPEHRHFGLSRGAVSGRTAVAALCLSLPHVGWTGARVPPFLSVCGCARIAGLRGRASELLNEQAGTKEEEARTR